MPFLIKRNSFGCKNKFVCQPTYVPDDLTADQARNMLSLHESICSEIAEALKDKHVFSELFFISQAAMSLQHLIAFCRGLGAFLDRTRCGYPQICTYNKIQEQIPTTYQTYTRNVPKYTATIYKCIQHIQVYTLCILYIVGIFCGML